MVTYRQLHSPYTFYSNIPNENFLKKNDINSHKIENYHQLFSISSRNLNLCESKLSKENSR